VGFLWVRPPTDSLPTIFSMRHSYMIAFFAIHRSLRAFAMIPYSLGKVLFCLVSR